MLSFPSKNSFIKFFYDTLYINFLPVLTLARLETGEAVLLDLERRPEGTGDILLWYKGGGAGDIELKPK